VKDEEAILDEAMDNLSEAAQRIRATQNIPRTGCARRAWIITLTTGSLPTG
jgi:hypothetical protein